MQKGFAPILAVVVISVLLLGGFVLFKNAPKDSISPGFRGDEHGFSGQVGQGLFGKCEGSGTTKLNTFVLDTKDIELIVPMGRVQDSHVTPTDHQYIIPKGTKGDSFVTDEPEKYQIKAPFDGYITNIELFKETVEKDYRKDPYRDNYLVVFEYSCDYYVRLIHIDTLSENINSQVEFRDPSSQHPTANPRIVVKKGDVIGTVGPHTFDFQIMDTKNPDKNILKPENIDPWTSITVDTFDYISDPLKSQLLAKNLRTRPPLGGKVGYDKEGTLLGNWFRVGRDEHSSPTDKNERNEYWTNNLSIVYDHLDESQIRISLGNFDGYPKAFGVGGNAPDPKDINKNSGLVKYELYKFDYYKPDGGKWDIISFASGLTAKNTEELAGVVLFEIQKDGKLKVETFPGKTKDQVNAFTNNAKVYER